jgi:hypothetical protein
MFSGSRCCLRTRVRGSIPSLVDFVPDPNLFFLYPQFFAAQQHTSTQLPRDAYVNGIEAAGIRDQPISRDVNQAAWRNSIRLHHVPLQPSQNPAKARATVHRGIDHQLESAAERKLEAIIWKRKARAAAVVRKVRTRGVPDPFDTGRSLPPPMEEIKDGPNTKARQRPPILSQHTHLERTLNIIANSNPHEKAVDGEKIWLTKSTLVEVSGYSRANSWVHQFRDGCEVEITDQESPDRTSRLAFLRGSSRAVALTRKHLRRVEQVFGNQRKPHYRPSKGSITPRATGPDSDSKQTSSFPSSSVRTVFGNTKGRLKHEIWTRADGLPSPTSFTVRNFTEYVEDLTTIEPPRLVKRELYGSRNEHHNTVVANTLYRLFTEPHTAPFASTHALDLALAFLHKHTSCKPMAKLLYEEAKRLRLSPTRRTYDYILNILLSRKEMGNFLETLRTLHSEGYKPGLGVWMALFKADSSLMHKYAIANWMNKNSLLTNRYVKGDVAAELLIAELEVQKHRIARTGLFLASVDARFGQDWMCTSSVTRILKACAANRAWTLATKIIAVAQERNVQFDADVLSVIFTVLQRRGSLRDSIELLQSHLVKTVGRNDHTLVPILFMTSWRHRFYNVCRVLWRYAAVRGSVTYKMQAVVTSSLVRNQNLSAKGADKAAKSIRTQEWLRRAGKVIVGTNLDISHFERFFVLMKGGTFSESTNPLVWLAQYTAEGEIRDQQLSLAYIMMHRDLEAWKYFSIPSSERLFNLLSEAYATDVRWKSEDVGLERGGKSTQWIIENAIDVPLVRREISLPPQRPFQMVPNAIAIGLKQQRSVLTAEDSLAAIAAKVVT